jgi:GPH family glycoside/pentoside/hexuronide:cation symporter
VDAEDTGRLPLLNKLLYTSDQIGSQAIAQTRNLWLFFFLVTPMGGASDPAIPPLDLGLFHLDTILFAGVLLTAGRVIEALDDPIIGWWSDRTQTRWGRRLPFVLFSTPFYALFFGLLWLSPGGDASAVNAVYIFVVLELFFLANTLSGGPYESLLPEIARSHRDRMTIVAYQFYFGILGAVLGLVLTGIVHDALGFKVMGMGVAVFGLAFRYLGMFGVWHHAPRETPPARIPLKSAFTATLRNKQFLYFIPTFVFFSLAVNMVIAWLPFFAGEVIDAESTGAVTSLLTLVALVGMALSVFLLWKVSNAKGKRWVYSACLLGTALYLPWLFFAGFVPGVPKLAQGLVMAFLAGLPMAGVNLLPRAITADITDYDELLTGMRREGMFYATQNLFEKVGSSFSALLLAVVLLLGRTAEDPLGIRMVGPVAGVFAFCGFWLFRGYRLPSTVTTETVLAAGLELPATPRIGPNISKPD